MLVARNLSKSYGPSVALDNLSLTVCSGEVLCLLGANGAGKTTTINLFLGLTAPSSGEVVVDGTCVQADLATARRAMAYIPENIMLYPSLTGLENLRFFASLANSVSIAPAQAASWLNEAGLAPACFHKPVSTYSKGMRQKVGIAIALAKNAKALLLDEPTSGLDPAAANDFGQKMQRLAASGLAILMATHDLFLAKRIAHRIGIMRSGVLVELVASDGISTAQLEALYLHHSYGRAA